MSETLTRSEQFAVYTAEQMKELLDVPATSDEKKRLVQYLRHWSPAIIKTNKDGGFLSRFLLESRRRLLLPISEVKMNERKKRILNNNDTYLSETKQISGDNSEIFEIIDMIRDEAANTSGEEQRYLIQLANCIEATIREMEFEETYELIVGGRLADKKYKGVNFFLGNTDLERISKLISHELDPEKPLTKNDIQILRLLLVNQRQLVILACIYRKYTPAKLLKKLRRLELQLVPQEIRTDTRTQTNAVFANHLMHMDKEGNIPFDLTTVRNHLNERIGAELY